MLLLEHVEVALGDVLHGNGDIIGEDSNQAECLERPADKLSDGTDQNVSVFASDLAKTSIPTTLRTARTRAEFWETPKSSSKSDQRFWAWRPRQQR